MERTVGPRERRLPDLDPTRDPQKPGPPNVPRDSRTPPSFNVTLRWPVNRAG